MSAKHKPDIIQPYEYHAQVLRVVDGDTLDVEVELGFEIRVSIRVRLVGVDAPEIYSIKRSSPEYRRGLKARRELRRLIPSHKWVEVKTYKPRPTDKFGRWLGRIYANGVHVNEVLREKGYAA